VSALRKILATLLVLGAAGGSVGFATYAGFDASTTAPGNEFETGTVAISDNDVGGAVIGLPAGSRPAASDSGCVTVTYEGSLAATVRLYAAVTSSGTSLAPYLTMTVTRGSGGTPSDCTGFANDNADYGYGSNGIVFQGKLSAFPTTYASGIANPPAGWITDEDHTFKFDISLDNNPAAQGLDATSEFFWEARSQ
jgi:hypothetical protein